MRRLPIRAVLLAASLLTASPRPFAQSALSAPSTPPAPSPQFGRETLHFGVEWRLVRAGSATLGWTPGARAGQDSHQVNLHLQSSGLVAKLYKVDDRYTAQLQDPFCAVTMALATHEGSRIRDTKVTVDRSAGKLDYLERDLAKDKLILSKQLEVPGCVADVIGSLYYLRALRVQPGQTVQVPITDGKRFAQVRVDAQEKEAISTPAGKFQTVRYEVHLLNGVIFPRKGRLFVWMTDDDRRVPVQLRVRMSIYAGTVTFQLEKEERA